jgi:hypothetical protein
MTADKEKLHFDFDLSKNQTVIWDAKTGDGTSQSGPPFPGGIVPIPGVYPKGDLICYATEDDREPEDQPLRPISWNFLIGRAIVVDFGGADGWAYEYGAWGFRSTEPTGAPHGEGGTSGDPAGITSDVTVLRFGPNYQRCPSTLLGQFIPIGAPAFEPAAASSIQIERNRLVVASCDADLRQDQKPVYTKLDFEIYDEQEDSFSYWQCGDSWYDIWLGEFTPLDPFWGPRQETAVPNFTYPVLRATAGYYRVRAASKTQAQGTCGCAGVTCQPILGDDGVLRPYDGRYHYSPGLVGTQSAYYNVVPANDDVASGSNLHYQSALKEGRIYVDATFSGKQ